MSESTSDRTSAADSGTAAFKRRFIIRLIAVLTGGMILDGYILGIIGPVSAQMKGDLGLTTAEMSMVAAAALFGILFGSPLGGWAGDKWGRKPLFMIDMGLFVLASVAQFFVTSFAMIFVVRLLMGVAIGAEYSVGWPMMSEFAPAKLRGRLMGLTVVAWYFGFLIGYTVGFLLNEVGTPWRVVIGSSTIIAAVLFIARLGLPESPRWLWNKGRQEEARAMADKYLEDVDDLEHEPVRKGKFSELFSPAYIRQTVFVSWFWFCNVLPYFAIATFAGEVLQQFGLHGLVGELGIQGIAVLGTVVTIALIDKAGRRVFTVPQQWIIMVIFLVIGLWSSAPPVVVLTLFFLFAFLVAMNGVLTSVYPGEVFPTEVRGVGTGFAAAVSRVGAGLGTFLLPISIESIGIGPSLLIMAVVVFSGALVSQLWAPETKGKSLSETAAAFSH